MSDESKRRERIVHLNSTTATLMRGDAADDNMSQPVGTAFESLMIEGWTVKVIVPVGKENAYAILVAPPNVAS